MSYIQKGWCEVCSESINVKGDIIRTEYEKSEMFNDDLYCLKIEVLSQYYGNDYRHDIIDNREKFENDFNELFYFNYWVIDSLVL
jgi:hypothetical protein